MVTSQENALRSCKDPKIVLRKDLVIPAGTVFSRSPMKTERFSRDSFSAIFGLTDDTSGDINYNISDDTAALLAEWFAVVR